MSDPVYLEIVRKQREAEKNAPNADCTLAYFEDGQAVTYNLYSLSYRHLDRSWSVNVWATSEEDAKERALAIASAEVRQIVAIVPA